MKLRRKKNHLVAYRKPAFSNDDALMGKNGFDRGFLRKLSNYFRGLMSLHKTQDKRFRRPVRTEADMGQSMVEYAVILAGFLALIMGMGVLWHLFDTGLVVEHALQSASHHLQDVAQGAWLDVFLP